MKKFIKIVLGVVIVFVVISMYYNSQVSKMQADPKKFYTEGLLNEGGLTELHKASYDGDFNKVSQLINQGHNMHAKTFSFKFTPFHVAIFKGHTDIADLLLSKGALLNEESRFKQTALHWAAFMGEVKSVEFLIQKEADLHRVSEQGWTALHYASFMGHFDIVKRLVKEGISVHKKNNEEQTAKDLAKIKKKEKVARYLSSY